MPPSPTSTGPGLSPNAMVQQAVDAVMAVSRALTQALAAMPAAPASTGQPQLPSGPAQTPGQQTAIKLLTDTLKATTAALTSLQRQVNEQAKQQKEQGIVSKAAGAVGGAVAGVAGIPTSIAGLIQAAVNSIPGLGSTVSKSFDLVLMQIGRLLGPVMLTVAKLFQDLAAAIKPLVTAILNAVNAIGGILKKIDEATGGVLGHFANVTGNLKEIFNNPFTEKEKRLDNAIADQKQERQSAELTQLKAMSAEDRKLYEERKKQVDPLGIRATMFGGGKATDESDIRSGVYAKTIGALFKGDATDPKLTAFRKNWLEMQERIAKGGVPKQEMPKGEGGEGGKAGMLHDFKPPGYHAQFFAVEEFARKLQLDALNQTPLDLEIMKQQRDMQIEMLAWMKGQDAPEFPKK